VEEDGSKTASRYVPSDAPIGPIPAPTTSEVDAHAVGASKSIEEHLVPMLDADPPRETVHTWKDFFIHIATIVIGLLIAVGLEQTVELFHHRYQVADTRKALQLELALNINRFGVETDLFRRFVPILQTNLAVFQYLKQHPGAAPAQWPGTLEWNNFQFIYLDNAWKTAQQSGVLAYMPEAELRHYAAIYRRLDVLNDYVLARITAVSRAAMYSIAQPDASLLSPAQTDDEVVLTTSALLAYTQTAALQYAMASQLHEFSSSPTLAEIRSITHRPINPEADRAIQALIDKVFKLEKGLSDASDPN
jgi:hypothetical protein